MFPGQQPQQQFPGQHQPTAFENKWMDEMSARGNQYFENHCADVIKPLTREFRYCLGECGEDPTAFNNCMQRPAAMSAFQGFQRCSEGLERKLSEISNTDLFYKMRECAQMGDVAPKSCDNIVLQFGKEVYPTREGPTPVMDEFNAVMQKAMQLSMAEMERQQAMQQGGGGY
eukprot:TRINITY_DN15972_c0_g1_i1.p1 TRINITY_DN15972_c0_g1~~TRINITY_DN15972_c0_g1_i1.p1  ORF type:complete len:172 (+),score=42.95 TRINITY_DN15972_c0_g1_i1:59-574(+)